MAIVNWYGDSVAEKINKAVLDGAEEWITADVKTEAQSNCPVDSGTLNGTHAVKRSKDEVTLGVGGPAAPYAHKQHDDATLSHDVGEDHWLENAFKNKQGSLQDKISSKVKSAL